MEKNKSDFDKRKKDKDKKIEVQVEDRRWYPQDLTWAGRQK